MSNGEPLWWQPCLNNISELGGTMCDDSVCQSDPVRSFALLFCTCKPPFLNGCAGPNPPPDCCVYSAPSPFPIMSNSCYCCCGQVGADIAAAPEEYRPLKEYREGDPVEAVSLEDWAKS